MKLYTKTLGHFRAINLFKSVFCIEFVQRQNKTLTIDSLTLTIDNLTLTFENSVTN